MEACHHTLSSRRLWSLWDMLKLNAASFYQVMATLNRIGELLNNIPIERRTEVMFADGKRPRMRVDLLADLGRLKTEMATLGTAFTSSSLDRLVKSIEDRQCTQESMFEAIKDIDSRVRDELTSCSIYVLDPQVVRYYGKKDLFGPTIAKKFKKAADDIAHAGNCLALREPTACVFHLSRALEMAVRVLGRRLGMTITPQTTWRQLTGNMDTKIRAFPNTTDRQKRKKNNWEAARANLHHLGSVWRNNTMHPGPQYMPLQAQDIFSAARVVMNDLCAL